MSSKRCKNSKHALHGSSHHWVCQTLTSPHIPQNFDSQVDDAIDTSPHLCGAPAQSHVIPSNLPTQSLVIVLINYAIFVFLEVSFTATFALFLSSPIPLGGLAFTPQAIGLVLGCAGIFHGLFQAFFFPRIHKRWEPRNVYAVSIVAYIPIYLCMPIMNALAKRAGQVTPLVWTLLALVEMACTFAYTAFSESFVFTFYCQCLLTLG